MEFLAMLGLADKTFVDYFYNGVDANRVRAVWFAHGEGYPTRGFSIYYKCATDKFKGLGGLEIRIWFYVCAGGNVIVDVATRVDFIYRAVCVNFVKARDALGAFLEKMGHFGQDACGEFVNELLGGNFLHYPIIPYETR